MAAHAHKPDDVTAFLALLDAFAATSARFYPSLMLHDNDGDGLPEYAFRLWCSANRLPLIVDHVRDTREYDVLRADLGTARTVCVFTKSTPLPAVVEPTAALPAPAPPSPHLALVPDDSSDDSSTRLSLLEMD